MGKDGLNLRSKLDGNELDLSLSELKEVPVRELVNIPKATHLDLSRNLLITLPPSFCTLTHIVRLDLSKNQLTELPANFGNLRSLQQLDLYSNQLKIVPVSFCHLSNLRWLDLKNNPLDARLKTVAGDCLDEKQCQTCAKLVVAFMQNINEELEKEQEKKLRKQKEKEAARKAAEEKVKERLRLEKKAAKEKRKAEHQKKLQQKQPSCNESADDRDLKDQENGTISKTFTKEKHSEKQRSGSCCFWVLAVMGLLLAMAGGLLWHYTAGDFSEKQLQIALKHLQSDTKKAYNSTMIVATSITKQVAQYFQAAFTYASEKLHASVVWVQRKIDEFKTN